MRSRHDLRLLADASTPAPPPSSRRGWRSSGVAAVLVAGSNGEAASLEPEERALLVGAVRAALPPDVVVLAGSGAPSARQAARLTRIVLDAGADGVLALSPQQSSDARRYYETRRRGGGRGARARLPLPGGLPPGIARSGPARAARRGPQGLERRPPPALRRARRPSPGGCTRARRTSSSRPGRSGARAPSSGSPTWSRSCASAPLRATGRPRRNSSRLQTPWRAVAPRAETGRGRPLRHLVDGPHGLGSVSACVCWRLTQLCLCLAARHTASPTAAPPGARARSAPAVVAGPVVCLPRASRGPGRCQPRRCASWPAEMVRVICRTASAVWSPARFAELHLDTRGTHRLGQLRELGRERAPVSPAGARSADLGPTFASAPKHYGARADCTARGSGRSGRARSRVARRGRAPGAGAPPNLLRWPRLAGSSFAPSGAR